MGVYDKQNYLCASRYVSGNIIEYDIRSANINCLRHCNDITQEEYEYLNNLPKMQREIEIGLKEKEDPKLYTDLQKTIREAREYLIKANNIDEDNIIRIANDAVYINTPFNLYNTKYGDYIEFRPKSVSNVYINLNKNVIFISFRDDGNIDVDVKGIGDKYNIHQMYIISAIAYTATILERSGINDALGYLSDIIEQYLKYQLPVGYYREFTSDSIYRFKQYGMFGLSSVSESDKYLLDIGYNYNILRELWSILIEIYELRTVRRR